MKKARLALFLGLLFTMVASPVLAAPGRQGGGIHFGSYTLSSGDSTSGDLTVFGPVVLKEDSKFDGDLTVFGETRLEEGAVLDGTLVVLGAARIAGTVDGDVFTAGEVRLEETAHVTGDVSAVGAIVQDEAATVEGEIAQMEEGNFDWDFPINIDVPGPVNAPEIRVEHTPFWVRGFWAFFRALANVVVMGLLALVIVSIWPRQTERVEHVIEEAPLTVFGVGLLIVFLTPLVFVLLAITLCLLPLGIIGLIVVGVGVLLGWVALGSILGRRILVGLFDQPQPNPVLAAVVGTALISLVMALAQLLWPVRALLVFILAPPAAGAVLLTRFGTMPYATQGRPSAASIPHPPAPPAPVPAPIPVAPASDETLSELEQDEDEGPVDSDIAPFEDSEASSLPE